MNKYACRYAIVQFMPYPVTGEVANAGVILVIPQKNIFAYRLETQKSKRYTDFFNHLDRDVYLDAIKALDAELKHCAQAVLDNQLRAEAVFDHFVRPLETIVRFTAERVRMVSNTNDAVDALFERLVMHGFAKAPNYEAKLQQRIASFVRNIDTKKIFRKKTIGPDIFNVKMPLVHESGGDYQAINPLFFNQPDPQKIIEHGNLWNGKLETLAELDACPQDILIPFEAPTKDQTDRFEAWMLVQRKLERHAKLVPETNKKEIINFVRN